MVEVDERPADREPGQHLQVRIGLHGVDAVERDIVDQMHLAGAQAGQADVGLGHLAAQHAVEIGRALPVVVEADQLDLVAELAAHELERPAADRRGALHVAGAFRHHHAGAELGDT